METYNQSKYRALRAMGRCVCCGQPAEKSRCPKCMHDLTIAVRESNQRKKMRMRSILKELEAMI